MTIIFRLIFIGFSVLYFIADHGNYNPNWLLIIYWPLLGFVYCLKCVSLGKDIKIASTTPTLVPGIAELEIGMLFKEYLLKSRLSICCLFLFSAYYFKYTITHLNIFLLIVGIPLSISILLLYNNILLNNNTFLEDTNMLNINKNFTINVKKIKILSELISLIIFVLFICVITKNISFLFINVSKCFEFTELFGFNIFTLLFFISLLLFELTAISFFKFSEFLGTKLIFLKEMRDDKVRR